MQIGTAKSETRAQTLTNEPSSLRLAEHLIGLPDSQWAFWRCVGLRGAGFPARGVLRLAAPEQLIRAADEVLHTERAVEMISARALEQVNGALDHLRESGDWEDKGKRMPLVEALQKLKMGSIPEPSPQVKELAAIDELRQARLQVQVARELFRNEFSDFLPQNSQALHQVAALPAFREAVTWQNRRAVHNALDTLLRTPIDGRPLTSKPRQDEELVASYLQRYCTKNDTIGFFGPVGWAYFVSSGKALTAQPGPELLATRKVYFETWPIEALGKAIARDRNIYPWIVPIRMPFIRVEGSVVQHPVYGPTRISPEHAAALRACDGHYTAKKIADTLVRERGGPIKSELQFYKALADLAGKGLVLWEFNIPFEAHPEKVLREALQLIDDPPLCRRALEMLDELESAREAVAGAAGNPDELDQALENIEQTFTRLTGISATRGEGKTYAGRTIVYEDCRRNVDVQLGPELLQSLAAPLSLLLASARWLTWEFAAIYRKKFKELYEELSRSSGENAVDAAVLFQRAAPFLFQDGGSLGRPVQKEFQKKWERILRIGCEDRPLNYSSEDLREEVFAEFWTPRAGWNGARYHSPDIMIVASGQEAIQRGDYLLAMGEMHLAGNTLCSGLFVHQHPFSDDLVHAVEQDMGGPNAVPLPQKDTPELLARTSSALFSPNDFRLEYGRDGLIRNRSRALPIASLVVEEKDGDLIARTRDRHLQFEIGELVGGLFHVMIVDSFRMVGSRRHTPRISIDRLVIKRESWRFSVKESSFAQLKDPADRFISARRWARAHGIPRFVFFKVPVERKPAYLDFASPTFVDIFCKMLRRTLEANSPDATFDITEMLPASDQVWLTDAAGERYTSELRIVAVDLAR